MGEKVHTVWSHDPQIHLVLCHDLVATWLSLGTIFEFWSDGVTLFLEKHPKRSCCNFFKTSH
jgi:hypothetical protein